MEPSHRMDIKNETNDRVKVLLTEIHKLKNRARAFAGAFVGMVSPVLLTIVLKKTNLKGAGKYQGTRMLEGSVDLFQGAFLHLAAVTLLMGMLPFPCVMISEACASWLSRHHIYIAERVLIASKMVVFFSNILLMLLGCGVLVFIHTKNAWFSWLVVSACFTVAGFAILLHICFCCCWWWYRRAENDNNGNNNIGGAKDYQSKLEHSLEFSAGITAMMFVVLESLVLEGLLRSSQLPQTPAPAPSEGLVTIKEPVTFLATTLLISFITSACAALLMNVWTIPLGVLTGAYVKGLNIALSMLATVVVFLVTLEGLQIIVAWLIFVPPCLPLFVLLARFTITESKIQEEEEHETVPRSGGQTQHPHTPEEAKPSPDGQTQQQRPPEKAKASPDGQTQQQEPPEEPNAVPDGQTQQQERPRDYEETKPAPLESTKVMFTGLLAVAVPGITNASPGTANKVFVFCAAATVLLGILWRLLTHHNAPSPAVRNAVNHSSFLAQLFLFCAGIAFWVMAINAPN